MHGHTNIKFSFSRLESLNQINGDVIYLVFYCLRFNTFLYKKNIGNKSVGLENCEVWFEFSSIEIKRLWWDMGK